MYKKRRLKRIRLAKIKPKKKSKIKMKSKRRETGVTLPLRYARIIWYISFIHFTAFIYGLCNGKKYLPFTSFVVGITSINYWKYPVYHSWERYIDIICVQLSLYYQIYSSNYLTTRKGYIFFHSLGILCFLISNYVHYCHNDYFIATILHIMLHIFGFGGNILLYTGDQIL